VEKSILTKESLFTRLLVLKSLGKSSSIFSLETNLYTLEEAVSIFSITCLAFEFKLLNGVKLNAWIPNSNNPLCLAETLGRMLV